MVLKNSTSEIQKVRNNGSRGDMQPATALGEHTGPKAISKVSDLPNTMLMVIIPAFQIARISFHPFNNSSSSLPM